MIVTATEFKTNFGKYLDMLTKEDIFITRNGKTIAKVINRQVSAVDSLRGIVKVCSVTNNDVLTAYQRKAKDFEDCLVATCAKSIRCDCIVTRNKKDFEAFDIPLLTPSELLQKLS